MSVNPGVYLAGILDRPVLVTLALLVAAVVAKEKAPIARGFS
jgi:hypothetical protein